MDNFDFRFPQGCRRNVARKLSCATVHKDSTGRNSRLFAQTLHVISNLLKVINSRAALLAFHNYRQIAAISKQYAKPRTVAKNPLANTLIRMGQQTIL